jgi:hypothetical protein
MRKCGAGLMRPVAWGLVLLLLVPFVSGAPLPPQDEAASARTGALVETQSPNPGLGQTAHPQPSAPEAYPNSPGSVRSQIAENNQPFSAQQAASSQQQSQEPVGTAAAESVETTGVAASKPAGAAIAPAKQRRTRALLIKVGALVGAGVAVGTVAALSSASPSRPPGAR